MSLWNLWPQTTDTPLLKEGDHAATDSNQGELSTDSSNTSRRLKQIAIFAAVIFVVIVFIGKKDIWHYVNYNRYKLNNFGKRKSTPPFYAIAKTTLPPDGDVLTHGAVGDLIFESTLQRQAARYGTYAESWEAVALYLEQPDIMYANFEGVTSYAISIPHYNDDDDNFENFYFEDIDYGEQDLEYGEADPSVFYSGGEYLQFNYHPMIADDLADSGVDIVSTVNNHCLDRGNIGINNTIENLDEAGVAHAGTRRTESEAWHAIVNVTRSDGIGEWKIAYVACTDGTNNRSNHRGRQKDLALNCYTARYIELVQHLAADPDIHAVIAVVHWGVGPPNDDESELAREDGYFDIGWTDRGIVYQREPDCAQRHFAQALAEAGAVAILGVHPHILQGWEKLTTSYGRSVLVAYSLANFVGHGGYQATKPPPGFKGRGFDSDLGFLLRRTSVILQFGLVWNKRKNWAEVSCLSYVPIWRSLTDVGYVEDYLTEQGLTTYEIHVESPNSTSIERQFIAERFGPLRQYSEGGGTYDGQDWEAQLLDVDGQYDPTSCYPFQDAPETKVDHYLASKLYHENDPDEDGETKFFKVAGGVCAKCERQYDDRTGCRWCQYRSNSVCISDDDSSNQIDLGMYLAWDDCLDLAAANADCSDVVYGGGGKKGYCFCMRQGERCNLASAAYYYVYNKQCGRTPRTKSL